MNPEREMYIREIVRITNENIDSIRRELINLEEIGLLTSRITGNTKQYVVNKEMPIYNELTDIISYDYSLEKILSGDIFISIDRVRENALKYEVNFDDELQRVIIHGILHFCGYKDKTKEDKRLMRKKEDYYLSLRTF